MSDLIEATIIQSTLIQPLVAQSSGAKAEAGAEGAAEATGAEGAAEATGAEGAAEATGAEGAAEATGAEGAAEATGAEGAAEATSAEGAAEATGAEGAAEATSAEGAAEATSAEGAAEATSAEGAAEATSAEGAAEATSAEGAAEATGAEGAAEATSLETTVAEAAVPAAAVPEADATAEAAGSALDFGQLVEIFNPLNAPGNIQAFIETGGNVLLVIMIATFAMWALIVERVAFFSLTSDRVKENAIRTWSGRQEHKSWYAHAIRDKLISEVDLEATRNINLIRGLVGVAPLLGLLGTVTGMIAVFDVMAITGSSNARLMAAGISKATIPTMAGLVTSLFGIAMMNILDSRAKRLVSETADKLLIE